MNEPEEDPGNPDGPLDEGDPMVMKPTMFRII